MRLRAGPLMAAATALVAILLAHRAAAVTPLNLTANANLGFGKIMATATAGTVTVSPMGAITSSGGVVLGNGSAASAANFTVQGQPNASYSITLPTSVVLSGGGSSMTADSFLDSHHNGMTVVGPTGMASFTAGATLHVAARQPSAAYSGTYSVTVSYN